MKKLKIIIISILILVIVYILFITIEVIRFNNNIGTKPLITIGTIDVDIGVGSNIQKEKTTGLGYTIEYEYFTERKENSDNQINKVISGEFKLFDKFLLSAWIE